MEVFMLKRSMRTLLIVGTATGVLLIACSYYFLKDPPSDSLKEFEDSLRASLPRCFSTADLESIAEKTSSRGVLCRPITISFALHDPLPRKLVCMPRERLAEHGPINMTPPLLLLTVDRECVTAVAH